MNIVVLVKQVPDTWAERKLRDDDKTLDRDSVDAVINEVDEFAIEAALQLQEANGGTVTVLSMGPERATEAVRKGLQMGADGGVLVTDDAGHGACALQTSEILAAAVGQLEYDLVITGSESSDARLSIIPAMLAERLGVPGLTAARKLTVDGSTVTIERLTDYGYDVVEAATPAVVSVLEKINEPRYPTFKGIMQAKKKPIDTKTLADLGVEAGSVGLAAASSVVTEFAPKPPRQAGEVVTDEGDGGKKIAEYLIAQKVV